MEKIKTLQFELWHNCNNDCSFCYLKKDRLHSSPAHQIKNIKKAEQIIADEGYKYNGIGLIGGEFFQGQLKQCKSEFLDLIQFIYEQENIKEVWITATLVNKFQDDLWDTLKLCRGKRTLICTSYDTIGRFRSKREEQQWFDNVKKCQDLNFDVHVTTIITQDFINKLLVNDTWLRNIPGFVDFRFPTIFWGDFQKIKSIISKETYRQAMFENLSNFPDNWYIKNRQQLFKCLNIIKNIFGEEKLFALQSNEVRSDKLYYLASGDTLTNRWDPSNISENAPCGHPWSNHCLLESDTCIQCDVLNFYNELKSV